MREARGRASSIQNPSQKELSVAHEAVCRLGHHVPSLSDPLTAFACSLVRLFAWFARRLCLLLQVDGERVLAAKVSYLLSELLVKHPNMKLVVVREVEQLMFRPKVSPRAQYVPLRFEERKAGLRLGRQGWEGW